MSGANRKAREAAFGGVTAGLMTVMMLIAGLLPTASYAAAALAGIFIIPALAELGPGACLPVYVAVSALSMLLCAQKDAALLYILILGWYPIAKAAIERIRSGALAWTVKFLAFNASAAAFWFTAKKLFFDFAEFGGESRGKWVAAAVLALANLAFFVYDVALGRLGALYMSRFHDKVRKSILF